MSKRSGGGAIRIAVVATSAARRAGLESIVRSHADFHLAGSFGAVASLVSFARSTELDVIVIDSDSIRDLLLEPHPTPRLFCSRRSATRGRSRACCGAGCARFSPERATQTTF